MEASSSSLMIEVQHMLQAQGSWGRSPAASGRSSAMAASGHSVMRWPTAWHKPHCTCAAHGQAFQSSSHAQCLSSQAKGEPKAAARNFMLYDLDRPSV